MPGALHNPMWQSLTTMQQASALGTGDALRYHPDVAPFVAIEHDTPAARTAALALVASGEEVYFVGVAPANLDGWTLLHRDSIVQMHWDGTTRIDADQSDIVELGEADAPDMLALTQQVFPGYFRRRTIELGRYVGVRQRIRTHRDGRRASPIDRILRGERCLHTARVCRPRTGSSPQQGGDGGDCRAR